MSRISRVVQAASSVRVGTITPSRRRITSEVRSPLASRRGTTWRESRNASVRSQIASTSAPGGRASASARSTSRRPKVASWDVSPLGLAR